jgi:hypothetical protein
MWEFMKKQYPPYAEYQEATSRQIPLVALRVAAEIERFT